MEVSLLVTWYTMDDVLSYITSPAKVKKDTQALNEHIIQSVTIILSQPYLNAGY